MLDYTLSKDLPDNHCWGSTKNVMHSKFISSTQSFFFFPAFVFSLFFIKPQNTHAILLFFSSLNLLSNSMFSQGQTAAFTFYGNCKYETHDDEFFVKTGSRKRLRFLNA